MKDLRAQIRVQAVPENLRWAVVVAVIHVALVVDAQPVHEVLLGDLLLVDEALEARNILDPSEVKVRPEEVAANLGGWHERLVVGLDVLDYPRDFGEVLKEDDLFVKSHVGVARRTVLASLDHL